MCLTRVGGGARANQAMNSNANRCNTPGAEPYGGSGGGCTAEEPVAERSRGGVVLAPKQKPFLPPHQTMVRTTGKSK